VAWLSRFPSRTGDTNLRALGVDDLTIMEILRHSDVSVSRASYNQESLGEKSIEAMGKLETELRKPVQAVRPKKDSVVPVAMA